MTQVMEPTTAIVKQVAHGGELGAVMSFDREKTELLKQTICRGASDDELELFIHACKRTGLDPFMKQIHAIKRYQDGKEVMTFQTGIDGYRLIAERTGKYMPGPKPTYEHDEDGALILATAYVKKLGPDNQWHTIDADAFFDEYAGRKRDGSTNVMWSTKAHIMLAKCAEALALRRAFPAELSGVYTKEEMEQADNPAGGGGVRKPVGKQGVGEEEPDLTDDATFLAEWLKVMMDGRGFDRTVAEKVLAGLLKVNDISLEQAGVQWRTKSLASASAGNFDKYRDAGKKPAAADAPKDESPEKPGEEKDDAADPGGFTTDMFEDVDTAMKVCTAAGLKAGYTKEDVFAGVGAYAKLNTKGGGTADKLKKTQWVKLAEALATKSLDVAKGTIDSVEQAKTV